MFLSSNQGNFECFRHFNFETKFLEKENFSKKKIEYNLLVESTKIENASFAHKNALQKANVKTNRIVSSKWTTKNGVLPVTTSFFGNFVSV